MVEHLKAAIQLKAQTHTHSVCVCVGTGTELCGDLLASRQVSSKAEDEMSY